MYVVKCNLFTCNSFSDSNKSFEYVDDIDMLCIK